MRWLKKVLRDLIGLFIDDGRLAIEVVLWLGLIRLLASYSVSAARWQAPIMTMGLLALLFASVLRATVATAVDRNKR